MVADGSVDDKINAGIERLLSMQTPSGGFGIWPGDTEPVLWGTAYVVHLLLDARDRGHHVPERALADAIDWLDRNAESAPGGPKFRGTHPGYVQYVLARAGKPHKAAVAKLLRDQGKVTDGKESEGVFLLKAALFAAGDRRYRSDLRDVDTSPLERRRYNDWSYYSDLRRRAMTLTVYHELFGADNNGVPLADLVADTLSGGQGHSFTTQELMWGVTGLGRWVTQPKERVPVPALRWNGRPVALSEERKDSPGQYAWQTAGASRAEDLTITLPEDTELSLALVATTEGLKRDSTLEMGSHGLSVDRLHYSADGEPLDLDDHDLGDLIYVRLSVTNEQRKRMENLALVDRIPAGWEIENPRLGRGALPDWVDDDHLWTVDYMDIKDDRFQVFGGLDGRQTVHVYYAVRAVTAGEFALPPVQAEAMYDPEVWARRPGGEVTVDGEWDDELL